MSELSFQQRVAPWMEACFGAEISKDRIERNHRFLEEALELVQACGCSPSEAHQIVDYVFGRDQGDINQEVGGVMVTLAALCLANAFDMHTAGETELARIWTKVEKIRAKQVAKPKQSPLPDYASVVSEIAGERRRQREVEGWSDDHDDRHDVGELAYAAACYALASTGLVLKDWLRRIVERLWPWERAWWKPSNPRRDLIKAGALVVAEIERRDRLANRSGR